MKIRTGFVSNSSSSSFIIAVKHSDDVCPHCGRKPINIENMVTDYNSYSLTFYSKGSEDIFNYYNENEYADADWLGEIKMDMDKYEKDGYSIFYFSAKHHNPVIDIIKSDPDVKIIHDGSE